MTATLTYGDLRLLVGQVLDERGVDTSQWSGDQITDGLNWALEFTTRKLGLTRVEGGPYNVVTTGFATLPNLLTVLYVRETTTMKLLLKTTPAAEDQRDPTWRVKTGTPYAWMDYDGSRIRVNRIPGGTYNVTVGYIETPTQFTYTGVTATDDAQTVDGRIPLFVQSKLALAAAAYLLRIAGDHQDMAKADALTAEFLKQIGADPGPAAQTTVER